MIQSCAIKVTHGGSGTWERQLMERTHRDRASDIVRAEGVPFAFSSSAPRAREGAWDLLA